MKHLAGLAPNVSMISLESIGSFLLNQILYLGFSDYMAMKSSMGSLYLIEESSLILIFRSEELHSHN